MVLRFLGFPVPVWWRCQLLNVTEICRRYTCRARFIVLLIICTRSSLSFINENVLWESMGRVEFILKSIAYFIMCRLCVTHLLYRENIIHVCIYVYIFPWRAGCYAFIDHTRQPRPPFPETGRRVAVCLLSHPRPQTQSHPDSGTWGTM